MYNLSEKERNECILHVRDRLKRGESECSDKGKHVQGCVCAEVYVREWVGYSKRWIAYERKLRIKLRHKHTCSYSEHQCKACVEYEHFENHVDMLCSHIAYNEV